MNVVISAEKMEGLRGLDDASVQDRPIDSKD